MSPEFHLLDRAPLRDDDRQRLHRLACDSCIGAAAPALVEALADGGVEPGLDVAGRPCAQRYGYVLVREAGQIVAAAPVVVTAESMADFVAGSPAFRAASERLRRHPRGIAARTLVVGTPLAQRGGLLLAPGTDLADVLAPIERAIDALADELACPMIIYKDLASTDPLATLLAARGHAAFVGLPGATIDLSGFTGLADYLRWIGTVASRGDLLRKARRAGYHSPGLSHHSSRGHAERRARWLAATGRAPELALEFSVVQRPGPALLDQIDALYRMQRARARFAWETLTRRCFERLAADPAVRFAVVTLGGELLAFSASALLAGRLVTLRAGAHPEAARVFSLPVLLVLRDIETALDLGCRAIELGPTSYALKARFGAVFSPTTSLLRVRPPYTAFTGPIAAAIDAAARAAGIAELHRTTYADTWAPPTRT